MTDISSALCIDGLKDQVNLHIESQFKPHKMENTKDNYLDRLTNQCVDKKQTNENV